MASWRRQEHNDCCQGPTGERNTWTLLPRERVLCIADDEQDALTQLAAVLAVGSQCCGRIMRCIVS